MTFLCFGIKRLSVVGIVYVLFFRLAFTFAIFSVEFVIFRVMGNVLFFFT